MQNEKVSIIVPIYKVEEYVHRCINSILNQTYSNLEIILVNDGSPDNGGEIAEEYKAKDNRIKVIHKNNGGLSDARNAGIKEITGDFTMFVDSDDWLDTKMIETMIQQSQQYAADIVQAAFYYAYDNRLLIDQRYYTEENKPVCLDNRSLMYELVNNERVKNFAWGKLYKTEIIINIPFKKGVLFEDVFWAHQVMHRVNHYLILHQPFYYYYQRDDSIVATYTLKNLDILKGLKERHRFIEVNYPELISVSYQLILKTCLEHYYLLLKNRNLDKQGLYRKQIRLYIQKNYKAFQYATMYHPNLKSQLYLFNIHPVLQLSWRGVLKALRRVSVLPQPIGLKKVKT